MRLGIQKKLGGDTAGTVDPKLTERIFHTTRCHAQHIKQGVEEGKGQSDGIFFSKSHVIHDGALLAWRWLNTCPLTGHGK